MKIREGEWANCIIHNIFSGDIHTIHSPYEERTVRQLVYKTIDVNIQSNLDANSKARARSWRLLKLEEAIAHREAGKYPISSDILDKTIDELKEILSAEK